MVVNLLKHMVMKELKLKRGISLSAVTSAQVKECTETEKLHQRSKSSG